MSSVAGRRRRRHRCKRISQKWNGMELFTHVRSHDRYYHGKMTSILFIYGVYVLL